MAAGIVTFFDPLRSRDKSNGSGASSAGEKHPGRKVRVATLDAVPDDGVPRQFPVIADRQDAWNYFPDEPIGMVYLRREKGSREVLAFNATCPHAGCLVGYKSDRGIFLCPCHTSSFQVDGSMIQPSPSPRAMDQVPATIEKHGGQETIWVWYQDFYTGKAKQIAKS